MKNNVHEAQRLKELGEYQILDTLPENEFDDITELASAICDTPVSLITLIDDKRQWFKSKVGVSINETPREHAFCSHALGKPAEVMVVRDSLKDNRFNKNPLVTGDPKIRFYAGAPLVTPLGSVLGTLCIIDIKPREFTQAQQQVLDLLAKQVMKRLESRKVMIEQKMIIENKAVLLKKLTDTVPGALYQLEAQPSGEISFLFISKGIKKLHPELTPKKLKQHAALGFDVIHPDDLQKVKQALKDSKKDLKQLDVQYRVIMPDGSHKWHGNSSMPERTANGTIVWFGIIQDITDSKDYMQGLEEITFSISHVIRRPVASLKGLIMALKLEDLPEEKIWEYIDYFDRMLVELDDFIHVLAESFDQKKTAQAQRALAGRAI